ncbi:hypothetical protein ABPG72_018686 [Tetrahymena utriculariae]
MILQEQRFYSFESFISQKETLPNFSCLNLCFGNNIENKEIVELGQELQKCNYTKKLTIDLSQKVIPQEGYQSIQKGLSKCIH